MGAKEELKSLQEIFPLFFGISIIVLGLLAVLHGIGWYLLLIALGLLVGLPLIDIDKILSKYLGTTEGLFHTFQVYLVLFILAVFVMTGSGSTIGKGIVLGMMVHGAEIVKEKTQVKIAYGLLAIILLLLFFF